MLKSFPIDFIRQTFEQKLLEQHIANPYFFGGENQVSIHSFYEQLASQADVDRFVETYRDLADQQNRTGLILNGTLISPENPSITNLYSSLIVPMTFTCSLRCLLSNRDQAIETLNNLINELKGRKVDIAQLDCVDENGNKYSTPFIVGTIGQNDGAPQIKVGDYLGDIPFSYVRDRLIYFETIDLYDGDVLPVEGEWYYIGDPETHLLSVVYYNGEDWQLLENDGTHKDIIFPPEHTSFEKYKLSFSFDAIRCDEPRNLNGEEYCELSFGGSATLVNNGVKLGNDLLKVKFSKLKIPADTDITFTANNTYLEPLEMPSGNNINTNPNQLVSNLFKTNSHADAITLTLQYTFICDENIPLLEQWYNYARYGTLGTSQDQVSPNLIYKVNEYYCSWGDFKNKEVLTKIVGDMDIENTESDTLTISVSMQIQGENN